MALPTPRTRKKGLMQTLSLHVEARRTRQSASNRLFHLGATLSAPGISHCKRESLSISNLEGICCRFRLFNCKYRNPFSKTLSPLLTHIFLNAVSMVSEGNALNVTVPHGSLRLISTVVPLQVLRSRASSPV